MKKFIAIILSVLFLLCACSETVENTSSVIEESFSSKEPSAVVGGGGGPVPSDAKKAYISNGAKYTSAVQADALYPDSYNSELTDGSSELSVDTYNHESLVGFLTKTYSVVIDLGEMNDKIYGARVSAYLDTEAGVSDELEISAYYSSDNVKWTMMGMPKLTGNKALRALNEYECLTKNYISARYIKLTITGNNAWVFLEEISVIGDDEEKAATTFNDVIDDVYANLGTISAPSNGGEIDKSLYKVNVANKKRYTFNANAYTKYTDDGTMLTDGSYSGMYENEGWVGFKGGKDAVLRIDLGEVVTDIAGIEAYFYVNPTVNIQLPTSLKVVAVDDRNNRTDLGILYGSELKERMAYTFTLPFKTTVSAKYIEITATTLEDMAYLVEEFVVYSYRSQPGNTLYPYVEIEAGEASEKPEASDVYKDIIYRKIQQIYTLSGTVDANNGNNSPVNLNVLTDGVFSGNLDIHNGKFFKFNFGERRHVIYDLQYLMSADKFTASFCHEPSWGVYSPTAVTVTLSDNGIDWYTIGDIEMKESNIKGVNKGELKVNKKLNARYVVFSFDVNSWAGCDELQMFGTESTAGGTSLKSSGYPTVEDKSNEVGRIEPSDDLLDGAKDLCLLYHNSSISGYKTSDLIPYVGYVDSEGNVTDTMFDSFLFLHTVGGMPSGAYPYSGSKLSDWQWSINDVFTKGENIYALEEAAGIVKDTLNLDDDFTYKITIAVYYPNLTTKNFGDVDGDGKQEDMTVLADRVKALKWYVDEVEKRFNEANFKNLELVGYYWFHEAIEEHSDPESKQLLNALADIVHTKGYDFTWIPYFTATGYEDWKEYGFDVACMQPNYVFNSDAPYSNIINCDKYTKQYGMGIEMEIDDKCLSNKSYFRRYMQYVCNGAELGYMNDTVVMYYQGVNIFNKAANSTSYIGRTVYDSTYHFIKGDLKNVPDTIPETKITVEKNTPYRQTIAFDTDKYREFRITELPEHGTVTITDDGQFAFYPEKDFTGEVTFKFVYNEYLSWSEDCVVTVTVQ